MASLGLLLESLKKHIDIYVLAVIMCVAFRDGNHYSERKELSATPSSVSAGGPQTNVWSTQLKFSLPGYVGSLAGLDGTSNMSAFQAPLVHCPLCVVQCF